eukprot:scaffold142252_cov17-Tisochrysis_lutea.AAC.1
MRYFNGREYGAACQGAGKAYGAANLIGRLYSCNHDMASALSPAMQSNQKSEAIASSAGSSETKKLGP